MFEPILPSWARTWATASRPTEEFRMARGTGAALSNQGRAAARARQRLCTASRFWFCQLCSDLVRPDLIAYFLNKSVFI